MIMKVNDHQYWVEDKGEGPALVMLHGFTGSASTFDQVAAHFSNSYRIIRVDLPGHARTGSIGRVTMEQFCRDLKDLLDQLGLSKVSLLGYSLGGRTALSFAVLYPCYVDRLILESASPGLATTEEQLSRQAKDKGLAEKLLEEGLEAFVDYWENIPLFHSHQRLPLPAKKHLRAERLGHMEKGLAESLLGMGTGHQPSWWNKLSSLKTPVLLITGGEDKKFFTINEKMKGRLPNAFHKVVEHSGHTVHLEKPSFFAKIVDSFMIE
ncbi:2-succinyl-6-hydroxy-2,4-cyclohexadiene-1-carboxylate synthase [Halobacillus karajensis]|uniref:Putative 2-succinyl-6-hydroxy-2,4-cyclohexadiene-1-carboxylate synthase n=2 Tax=Halobacillus karajensis TaxID=195088 RepID=A0A024P9L0_9BACI|nr:2-succinyl-6-hydroxy-2,4-cyclohexadiene-1-carboxylate synthase [Halobacillus karajensis]CDQ21380.1 2-succinyl-6-hydroxy-2, 4-cyclohexadiene-1-carboxylate synthase [Halobacillus karajensis]CDQ25548.1 2-succinyl-6-hydroxy-2, 4-cyclohexadiene-1-carboxylate synthase [Halobacillus karajensis]CDQ25819.1 2-succinyl-6-hydroxy-2, 4-cyclohexadiene-1-carboxylate synthase [Halobacillus karajensis]SEI13774.1 2-succinyl-6-hydroxy-2,4-cyclohexadiene-1-carboxylate synthase [Halobacillus karajensis]